MKEDSYKEIAIEKLDALKIPKSFLDGKTIANAKDIERVISECKSEYNRTQFGEIEYNEKDIKAWADEKKADIEKYGRKD